MALQSSTHYRPLAGRDLPDDAAARIFGLAALPDMARDKIAEDDHRTFGFVSN
ncbi:hypothetical protein [Bosea sp. AAP35]|uniref:DUF6894 family protein n=1 Tax=Bosea sp. AAP35 TaxID=1523417 RepID=UPI000AE8D989|nr:hypothetical protein [Bosea sp. AAP35]